MHIYGSLSILWHCLSLGLEWKLTFSSPVASAEFSWFAGILSAVLYQHYQKVWNSSAGITWAPLALFTVILPKAHLIHTPDFWLLVGDHTITHNKHMNGVYHLGPAKFQPGTQASNSQPTFILTLCFSLTYWLFHVKFLLSFISPNEWSWDSLVAQW